MKKQEYFDKLELELRRQNVLKVTEILSDYEEHFAMGSSKGKTEEVIVEKLGDPLTVAKAYQAEALILQIEDAPVQDQAAYLIRAFLRLVVVTPLNFVMLLGPVLILSVIVFTMWTVVLSLAIAGFGVSGELLASLSILTSGIWGLAMSLFGGIAIISWTLLGILVMFFITRFLFRTFIDYLRWNIQFIKGDAK